MNIYYVMSALFSYKLHEMSFTKILGKQIRRKPFICIFENHMNNFLKISKIGVVNYYTSVIHK